MLLIIFVAAVVLFFFYGIHQYVLDKRYNLPPGPTPLPFLGNFLSMAMTGKLWVTLRNIAEKHGSAVTLYMGQYRMLVFTGSDAIQEAFVTNSKIFSDRPSKIAPGFKNVPTGVLFANGPLWRQRRRFSLRALRDFGMGKIGIVENIHYETGFFMEEVEKLARSSQPFDPKLLLANVVSNVICSFVFGRRFNYDDEEFQSFLQNLNTLVSRQFGGRQHYFMFPFIRHLKRPAQAEDLLTMLENVKRLLKVAIADHREDFNPEHIRDFPDLFIQAEMTKEAMDLEGFGLTMVDLFAAGTETTSTALNWALLYLSTYPDIQRKCQDAIDEVIESDRFPDFNDRPNLVYVDAVMCEVFRHATIAPLSVFHATADTNGQMAGFDIPANTFCTYNIWALHHDPTYWSEPDRFDPDRWIDPETGKLLTHSSYFMPFGVGPRVCLGELLAKAEFFVFLVSLLQRYNFELTGKVDMEKGFPGITYSPPRYEIIASNR